MTTEPSRRSDAPAPQNPPTDGSITAARLHGELRSRGGFTIDLRTGDPVSAGVAVCAEPGWGMRFPLRQWDDGRVARWLARCDERLRSGDTFLGGWLQASGDVWLDVVHVFPEEAGAIAEVIGRRAGQRAGFDLARRRLIPLVAGVGAVA